LELKQGLDEKPQKNLGSKKPWAKTHQNLDSIKTLNKNQVTF